MPFDRSDLAARLHVLTVCCVTALVVVLGFLSNAMAETRASAPRMSETGALNFFSATAGVLSDGDHVPIVDAIVSDAAHAVIGWHRQHRLGVTIVGDDGRGIVRLADCEGSLCISYGSSKSNLAAVEDSRPGATSAMLRSLGLSEALATASRCLPAILRGDTEMERSSHEPVQPIIIEHNFLGWALGANERVVDLDLFQLRGCRARLRMRADAVAGYGYQVSLDPSERFCELRLRAYRKTSGVAADVIYEAWLPSLSLARHVDVVIVNESSGARRSLVAKVVGNKVTAHIPSSVIASSGNALRLQLF